MVCQKNLMKKIIVIGCPGSGKSRLSRKLCAKLGMPLCHLDMLYWNADKTTLEHGAFLERLSDALAGDCWIIDGNYQSTLEWRIAACDLVVFLDYPTEMCLAGVRTRRGQARSDIPWVEDGEDEEFLSFIQAFKADSRPIILSILGKYPHKTALTFRTREEADEYLRGLSDM